MSELCTCHLPNNTALFCIGVNGPDQVEALQRHVADIVFSNMRELGGR